MSFQQKTDGFTEVYTTTGATHLERKGIKTIRSPYKEEKGNLPKENEACNILQVHSYRNSTEQYLAIVYIFQK